MRATALVASVALWLWFKHKYDGGECKQIEQRWHCKRVCAFVVGHVFRVCVMYLK